MPGHRKVSRSQRPKTAPTPSASPDPERQLMLIDNSRLQNAAWADFHTARKRLEKASGDLHRHEQIDAPEYEKWIHQTFPTWITRLRQLHEEVFRKGQKVQHVQALSLITGRSPKKLWRDLKAQEANPKAAPKDDEDGFFQDGGDDADDFFEDEPGSRKKSQKRLGGGEFDDDDEDDDPGAEKSEDAADAKSIYRRLVQRLHPDRGGEWSPARKRLWNEVQLAWDARDADWLARLEVEWETNNDILGPTSALGRLRAGIAQLLQARRDIERKLRNYRRSSPWRFTLSEKKRETLHQKTENNFKHDLEFLQNQLAYLNATIAAWERPAGMARSAEYDDNPEEVPKPRRRSRR